MSRFIQLHVLTSYPPSNLNRDDLGRPKTAVVGGATRLRVSSQALKRAWRTSEVFRSTLGEMPKPDTELVDKTIGKRSKAIGQEIFKELAGVEDITVDVVRRFDEKSIKTAFDIARMIAVQFGKLDGEFPPKRKKSGDEESSTDDDKGSDSDEKLVKAFRKALNTGQLVHLSPMEEHAIQDLTARLRSEARAPRDEELDLLRLDHASVDIGLFGRMLAESPSFNIEAATQVAHAITVHRAEVEDDYFTAVDDLNMGAAHIGETGFGAGVYYLYVCIDRALLDENLAGDTALRNRALAALIEAIAKVGPTGKQNSFASRAFASLVLAEKGHQQPRSLSLAFLKPVNGTQGDAGMMASAIEALMDKRKSLEDMYGAADACLIGVEGEYRSLAGDKAAALQDVIAFAQAD